ncbi:MAG: TetR/AcrR family transcriptional regulator [Kutzneria sp.]|nr:TetR/AcrR family transcriptional regulator [Kutzneria sp.]
METTDHRKGPRRRGDELNRAIFTATMAELLESGYAKLTMDRVAERARTSKASLYRRWPSRVELALDTVLHHFPDAASLPNTGDLRTDLVAALRLLADTFTGSVGTVVRSMMADIELDPELGRQLRVRALDQRNEAFLSLLRRAAMRGEARGDKLTQRIAGLGPALLREHITLHGVPVPDVVIEEIVDEVLLPLVSTR